MPVMDGFELCRRWKADRRLRSIPFVVYTATYTDAQDEAFAISLGADLFLLKPMGPEELAQAVLGALASVRGGSAAAAPAGAQDEKEILQQYSEVLFRKLEAKVAQLETEMAARDRAEREVRSLNSELEERVRRRTAELESANRELEAFSYSVAHDLRAPLRAIDGYSALLDDALCDTPTAECRKHLARIRANVLTMATLIDRLLELSRMGRVELRKTRLDMSGLARTAFAQLGPPEEVQRVAFRVAELPEAEGDAALLGQVFANLLSNALKFSSGREKPVIEVGSRDDEGRAFWFVRDNGAGFDMRFADKLFGVFQRLHAPTEFPGVGVGLAIVQRIVTRHGGTVRAEGRVGEGAEFSFSL
ncbi:MAG: response regulator [Holophagales bacterium]|nr:response regulator [Holophagales bacterium]